MTATDATQVMVSGTDGSSYTLAPSGGTQSVNPATTTTYTVNAIGVGGTASATATVTVGATPAPTVTIAANPSSIQSGASSTLTVAATNATAVTVTGTDGSNYTFAPTGGTQPVSPTATTTYTANAVGAGVTVSATATVTVAATPAPTVTITANPASIQSGASSTLTVAATNATVVTITGSDGSSYNLPQPTGGTQSVSPTVTTTYTADANGSGGNVSATATVTVLPPDSIKAIDHVIFMLQENHSFDNYFGMLNPYRKANGWTISEDGKEYDVDGIDDKLGMISNVDDEGTAYSPFKLKSTCIDDESSDWLASYGDVSRFDFSLTRPVLMDGFVHDAEGYAKSCAAAGTCSGDFTDLTGQRAMGYYEQDLLNYYYYMASQFAVSDRWFSPVATKSVGNRIATFTGGTTQGLVYDPGNEDHLPQLAINNIFEELQNAGVSWKIYYSATQGYCLQDDDCPVGASGSNEYYPATYFSSLSYSYNFLRGMPAGGACPAGLQPSSTVGDPSSSFCIDPTHIAPLNDPTYGYFADLQNGTLPSFAFIEAGYGRNDEHPGSDQSILEGQAAVARIVNALMASTSWKDSAFFLSYDEGGGPYDHVPPVPGHSNDFTDPSLGTIPDISTIAVSPDGYKPCVPSGGTPTIHCDLKASDPGATPSDAAAQQGFAAQLGFRVPNIVISPFTREHYVSHLPMDHTAVIKFVENRFIGPSAHLTARDAAQPNLLDFFDFANPPWLTPPTPPTPLSSSSTCNAADMGP
ncbi:MAG: alkaline phosphatase family protein [Acidobacteriaceae bacterium]